MELPQYTTKVWPQLFVASSKTRDSVDFIVVSHPTLSRSYQLSQSVTVFTNTHRGHLVSIWLDSSSYPSFTQFSSIFIASSTVSCIIFTLLLYQYFNVVIFSKDTTFNIILTIFTLINAYIGKKIYLVSLNTRKCMTNK